MEWEWGVVLKELEMGWHGMGWNGNGMALSDLRWGGMGMVNYYMW